MRNIVGFILKGRYNVIYRSDYNLENQFYKDLMEGLEYDIIKKIIYK